MIQYYYTKKEWGVVMEKEELKILEELRRILNSKNEAIVILNNYFKGGVGKSKLSTMFAYLTDKFNLKVLMIDKDLQATLTKDLAKTFKVELPRVNFYEGLKNGNLASSIVHLTDNLDLIPGTFDLMLLPKLTRSWTFENESRLLATLLAPLKSDYDLIIIDTVPTPSVYTNNAIVASDYVMIPLQAEEESTNNIQNYISYLIDLQEQFNPGLDMIGFVPYLVDTDSTTIKSNLEELYKQHKEDNLVFQNIIKRSNKVSTWSKNGITEHKGYDKKVLSVLLQSFLRDPEAETAFEGNSPEIVQNKLYQDQKRND
ncbi:ParA family protein [Streptococcus suis]|nr:ParA family protein [Streptococcus suis]